MQTDLNRLKQLKQTEPKKSKKTLTQAFVSFSLINAPGDPKVGRWLGIAGMEGIGELGELRSPSAFY